MGCKYQPPWRTDRQSQSTTQRPQLETTTGPHLHRLSHGPKRLSQWHARVLAACLDQHRPDRAGSQTGTGQGHVRDPSIRSSCRWMAEGLIGVDARLTRPGLVACIDPRPGLFHLKPETLQRATPVCMRDSLSGAMAYSDLGSHQKMIVAGKKVNVPRRGD